eukprot:TRINITY_DN10220_c0_g2_i3.p1 TRINITY_DN10220_c0_g2~~TRINITY_DN10220_c0_g2_i3.p1  ORF type:complete len:269 (-),score=54.12 TRINITY_DN10220_c0_g2_i3:699-1505(-)
MERGKQGVTFQEFSTAQFASSEPAAEGEEPFNAFECIFYSVRISEAQPRSHATNAKKARTRAVNLRHAVLADAALDRQARDEVVEIANDAEMLAEQEEQLPVPPPAPVHRDEKVVRFLDQVDTQQFSFVPTKQCELGSAHEFCLNTFVSRVASSKFSSHAVTASDALDRAWLLKTEVELQQREEISSADVHTMLDEKEPWLVIETSSDEESLDEPSCAQSKACGSERWHKPVKKDFWTLDTRGIPAEVRSSCEGKRWQDQVRHCSRMF